MTDDPVAAIRVRLVEISDELRALPDTDFSGKHKLNLEADALRQQLAEQSAEGSEETLSRWADRSGRKTSHTPDEDLERAKAALIQPSDGGGGA